MTERKMETEKITREMTERKTARESIGEAAKEAIKAAEKETLREAREAKESAKVLQVQMFGGFSMRYGGKAIALNRTESSKSIRLLKMLLLSLPEGIPKNELMDNLYDWNEKNSLSNRNKNLNNLIYRLKGQLMAYGLPEDDYVEIDKGRCHFKSRLSLVLDTRQFEEMVMAAREDGRTDLYHEANKMYVGELLPGNSSDIWFFQKSNHYKKLYVETIRALEKKFRKENNYMERLQLYNRAAMIYPFEEWQVEQIRCNLEMYRYKEARDIYNATMELYAREMGSPPTEKMQECFEQIELMDEGHKNMSDDFKRWKKMDEMFMGKNGDIRKAIFEEEQLRGAYYFTYPSFVDYCRIVERMGRRRELPAVLMFLTLSRKKNKGGQGKMNQQEQMDVLRNAIGDSLRDGDAYTRYGNRHFIVMLVQAETENCSDIFCRIEKSYLEKNGKGELWYYANMTHELAEENLY